MGEPLVDTVSALHGLAREKFGELSAAEIGMLDGAMTGTMAYCGDKDGREINPVGADQWGKERIIRASLLRWLLINRQAKEHVDPLGVQVAHARIEGDLNLSFSEVDFPLLLLMCSFPNVVLARDARLRSLYLTGCCVGQIIGDGLHVAGDVLLNQGFEATGTVQFVGASIPGHLSCINSKFKEVILVDAIVGGNFGCRGSFLNHPTESALIGDRLQVGGDVFLDQGFQASGAVRFLGASITGNLRCSGSTFDHPDGKALSGDQLQVGGSVFLDQGFQANGEVRFLGASIAGNLECTSGTFNHPHRIALNGDRLQVGDSIFLNRGFQANGEVRLPGVSIAGDLSCSGTFDEFLLANVKIGGNAVILSTRVTKLIYVRNATIKGTLIWKDVEFDEHAHVTLSHSRVYQLDDGGNPDGLERVWPTQSNLDIDGLVYETLPDNSGNQGSNGRWVEARLKWIELQSHYTPQPYEQLITVLRRMGHEDEARTVAIAKQEALRKSGTLDWWSSKRNWFLGITIGHGYRPWRPLAGGAFFIAIGALLFTIGFSQGLLTGNPEHRSLLNSNQIPLLFGAMYSLDVFLPIIDFGLGSVWYPIPKNAFGWVLLIYAWVEIGLGWVISTLFVLAFTNLIRKD